MPTNLFGLGDNYHPEHGHVAAALIRRFHEAKQEGALSVTIWGTGTPKREFPLRRRPRRRLPLRDEELVGARASSTSAAARDIAVGDFARAVADTVGYRGGPGVSTRRGRTGPRASSSTCPRLDRLGWHATTSLRDGLKLAYADFLAGGGRNR